MKYPVSLACLLPVLQFFACKFCTGFAIYIIDNKGDIEASSLQVKTFSFGGILQSSSLQEPRSLLLGGLL